MTIYVYANNQLVADKAEYKMGVVTNEKMEKVASYVVHDQDKNPIKIHLMVSGNVTTVLALREWVYGEFVLGTQRLSDIALENLAIHCRKSYSDAVEGDEFDGLLVFSTSSGKHFAYFLGDKPYPVPVKQPYAGGYRDAVLVALGALDAGASSEDAVRIALARTNIANPTSDLTVIDL